MWLELFLCLLLAHLVADFMLQTANSCKDKVDRHWRSPSLFIHAAIVFALSWLAAFDLGFWWCALLIGAAHYCIDLWKSYLPEKVTWFSLDQVLHLTVLAGAAYWWSRSHAWQVPFGIDMRIIAAVEAVIICWKPANLFIKLMLRYYSVNMPDDKSSSFNAGALIGTIERWLILIFVCLHCYEALGLLIAAKSIIRFGDSQTNKSEYVLAGTLLSIFIAVVCGLLLLQLMKVFDR